MKPRSPTDVLRRKIEGLEGEVEELRRGLSAERAASRALEAGQVDAVLDPAGGGALLVRAAQAALQASEERYRTIVTTSDEGIFTADASGRATFANKRMARMLGYTVEEIVGHTSDYFLQASASEAAARDFEHRRQGGTDRRDLPLRCKDGSTVWASVTSSPLLDPEGRFAGSLGMVTDITDRRRLEAVRRKTEERFSLVFNASPIPLGISTLAGDILEVNDRFAEFFGYTHEELIGQNKQELGLWADLADRELLADVMRRDGRARDLEVTFRRKSGETREVLLSVDAIELQDSPDPVRIFLFTDVTDRKRAEQTLRESRALLEQAQAVGHIGSWVSDAGENGSLWFSEEAKRIFGFVGEEFDGRLETFFSLVHSDDRETLRAVGEAAILHGKPYSVEHRIVRRDGAVRLLHAEAQVVRDDSGQLTKMVGVVQDVTERHAAEEVLRENEERYRALFEESPMPMFAYETDGLRIVMANQAAAILYGYAADELRTLALPDIRPSEDAEMIQSAVRALPPGRHFAGTFQHKRKDGSVLLVDVHLNDVRLGGRRLKLAVLHDVTERRGLEEQLRRSPRRWRPSAASRGASPTTSTISSRRSSATRTCWRNDSGSAIPSARKFMRSGARPNGPRD